MEVGMERLSLHYALKQKWSVRIITLCRLLFVLYIYILSKSTF